MTNIKESAHSAAWQIFEEIGLSKHSVDRVSEIIAERISEQKAIDINKACEWLKENLPYIVCKTNASEYRLSKSGFIETFRKAMEE